MLEMADVPGAKVLDPTFISAKKRSLPTLNDQRKFKSFYNSKFQVGNTLYGCYCFFCVKNRPHLKGTLSKKRKYIYIH